MSILKSPIIHRMVLSSSVLALAVVLPLAACVAQERPTTSDRHSGHAHKSSKTDKSLVDQIQELRAKVARLEPALEQSHKGQPVSPTTVREHSAHHASSAGGAHKGMGTMKGMGMGSMKGMDMSSMKGMDMSSMKGMGMGSMKGMGMGSMSGMGRMQGMSAMGSNGMNMMGKMGSLSWSWSALPGFPGASHLYHIGASDFFLDHAEHIVLTTQQQGALNKIKEKSMLKQASLEREIDEAEQQLWELTSADQPIAKGIEAKIREIEKLRGDQRLAFIGFVGEAAKVLTDHQRRVLTGTASPESDHTSAQPKH